MFKGVMNWDWSDGFSHLFDPEELEEVAPLCYLCRACGQGFEAEQEREELCWDCKAVDGRHSGAAAGSW